MRTVLVFLFVGLALIGLLGLMGAAVLLRAKAIQADWELDDRDDADQQALRTKR